MEYVFAIYGYYGVKEPRAIREFIQDHTATK